MSENPDRRSHSSRKAETDEYVRHDITGKRLLTRFPLIRVFPGRQVTPRKLMLFLYPRQQDGVEARRTRTPADITAAEGVPVPRYVHAAVRPASILSRVSRGSQHGLILFEFNQTTHSTG